MESKDLMIGDWVCTESDSTPRQISWIRTGEVGLYWNKVVTPPYLVPIPLTREILEKNGFDFERGAFKEDEYKTLEINIDDGVRWTINCNEYDILLLEYVHQLQHALRLCGIDKEIEL